MVTYRSLFAVREFRYLYPGMALSYLGDQFAKIAVAVLVFDRTGSAFVTAVAYASSMLPALGGPLLGAYADRLPRKRVLIACDLVRAVLVAVLVTPGLPIWLAIGLLYVLHLFTSPFTAARAALMPEVLAGDAYVTGNGLTNVTFQLSQLVGLAVGGVMVTVVHPRGALALDAVTFAASAVLIVVGVRARPAPSRGAAGASRPSLLQDTKDGARYVFSDPWLRNCLLVVWAASTFAFAFEGIAYPYAKELHGGSATAGVMLASTALGFTLGAILLTRVVSPATRDRLLAPFAVAASAVLVLAFAGPPLWAVLAILFVTGIGASFSAPLNAIFVRRVAAEYRGRAMGVAIAGITAGQGLGFLLAGALGSTSLSLATVVGLCGLVGAAATATAALGWQRAVAATADEPAVVG